MTVNQESKRASRGARGSVRRAATTDDLMRAKLSLVAARERSEPEALASVLATHPTHALELTDFLAALAATSGYEQVTLTADSERIAQRAMARAMANAFPAAAPVAAPAAATQSAVASLRALRRARGLTPRTLADRLGIGVDILSSIEAGLIRVASLPERLIHALSAALDATAEQVNTAIQLQATALPALLRSREGASKQDATHPEQDFDDAIRHSPNMTDEQKARWLEG